MQTLYRRKGLWPEVLAGVALVGLLLILLIAFPAAVFWYYYRSDQQAYGTGGLFVDHSPS